MWECEWKVFIKSEQSEWTWKISAAERKARLDACGWASKVRSSQEEIAKKEAAGADEDLDAAINN